MKQRMWLYGIATLMFAATLVSGQQFEVITTSLSDGTVGSAYSQTLSATSDFGPYVTWSIVSGSLPGGLSLSSDGTISGTPTAVGQSSFTVQATVSADGTYTATQTLSILINARPPRITTISLPDGMVGAAYSQTFTSSGGNAGDTLTWSVSSGTLPPGLNLSPDGVLSGTPTASGSYSFVVLLIDSSTSTSASRSFTLAVPASPLTIATSASLPPGSVGVAYSKQISATGGAPAYAWSISSGALPGGVGLNTSSGLLSGTPTSAGSFSFQLAVTDQAGGQATSSFMLVVTAPLIITTSAVLPIGSPGVAYSTTLSATGGVAPYTWSISSPQPGSLPSGVTLDPSTGLLAGTPKATGSYQFLAGVADAAGRTTSKLFTFNVVILLAITTPSPLPNGAVGSPYHAQLAATGGTPAYTWSIASGALPAGLTLDPSTGILAGTPSAGGAFNVTIGVKDAIQSATTAYVLTITVPTLPTPTIKGLPDSPPAASQPTMGISLNSGYSLDLTGHATMTFAPDAAADDPAVQFTTGGRSADFQIPAGATEAVFGSSTLGVQTGTVAGTITITLQFVAAGVDVTPTPAPTIVLRIAAAPPVITSAKLVATSTGFDLQVVGYSTTRQVTGAAVHLIPASGAKLTTSDFTIALTTVFTAWYQDAASVQYGSQFSLSIPFAVQKVANAVGSLTVTLTNAQGTSAAATATF